MYSQYNQSLSISSSLNTINLIRRPLNHVTLLFPNYRIKVSRHANNRKKCNIKKLVSYQKNESIKYLKLNTLFIYYSLIKIQSWCEKGIFRITFLYTRKYMEKKLTPFRIVLLNPLCNSCIYVFISSVNISTSVLSIEIHTR